MGMKRTTVFADEEDLAVIKAAAGRRGVSEAEILRGAIHLAAMANRTWDEPFFSRTFTPQDEARGTAEESLRNVWTEKSEVYEQTKSPAE